MSAIKRTEPTVAASAECGRWLVVVVGETDGGDAVLQVIDTLRRVKYPPRLRASIGAGVEQPDFVSTFPGSRRLSIPYGELAKSPGYDDVVAWLPDWVRSGIYPEYREDRPASVHLRVYDGGHRTTRGGHRIQSAPPLSVNSRMAR